MTNQPEREEQEPQPRTKPEKYDFSQLNPDGELMKRLTSTCR